MKTIVVAYHNMGCAGLEALLRNDFEVQAVFTYADRADEAIWFDSVAEVAARHGIPVFAPDDINHPLWVQRIRDLQPEILFSFYYRDLLKPEILAIPKAGCLNLHGSLLPKYRGRAPVNWALLKGERETGVTLHDMTTRADDGDIVCQHRVLIDADETALTLNNKLVAEAATMLDACLPLIRRGQAARQPQNHAEASYFGRRRPEDGLIDWSQSSQAIHNLVRAVTRPYPGAFSYRAAQKLTVWESRPTALLTASKPAGSVLKTDPLTVVCGEGALEIRFAQSEGGVYASGAQLAQDLNLMPGTRLGSPTVGGFRPTRKSRVLILGVNGFIGHALLGRLLDSGRYQVQGLDLYDHAIQPYLDHPDFSFQAGDIGIQRDWVEYQVKTCDVVLPLIAIATPIDYARKPLRVFELDFEENLRVVRHCARYGKRLIFPSTSEVYGMCADEVFDEQASNLVLGPIHKQRWIYSASKQLLDRVIWAYGRSEGLKFTLFRPFNWVGPRLDTLDAARRGSARVLTQMILNLVEGTPVQLIDGGEQRRCFTDLNDGVEALFRIIDDTQGVCHQAIINIGHPDNDASIRELAETLMTQFERHPLRGHFPVSSGVQTLASQVYYGEGYEDIQHRKPNIETAKQLLDWTPKIVLEDSVAATLDFFLRDALQGRVEVEALGAAFLPQHRKVG